MRLRWLQGCLLLAASILVACGSSGGVAGEAAPRAEGSVAGRVVGASGQPLAGALVELCPSDRRGCSAASTDAGGTFAIVAPPGAYTIRITDPDAGGGSVSYYRVGALMTDDARQASVILVSRDHQLGDIARGPPAPLAATAAGAAPTAVAEATPVPTRVRWLDGEWFLLGVNLPWVHWSCDFGVPSPQQPTLCEPGANVSGSSTQAILEPRFRDLQERDVHVVRWWVFPDEPWQIQRDEAGLPAGLVDSVYEDFDAALALAERYDLYYVFTLFSHPLALPDEWRDDAAARALLADSLRPLFARYAGNDRVLSWQVFNEPEWDIRRRGVDLESARATVGAIAEAVHDSSNAYVSVGSATLDGTGLWRGLGLDYYTAHWYDPMAQSDCAVCTTVEAIQRHELLDAPLVIGEYFGRDGEAAVDRLEELYARGYAGAWAWSLLSQFTMDTMTVDLDTMAQFASTRDDIGP